jgi:acetylornithine deacetylase/succinyl-diaminopimelate desuccinylase-like protein
MRVLGALLVATLSTPAAAQTPDWNALGAEALETLQTYVRINTSNPPGDVVKAAGFLIGILEREGIPVKRFEAGNGRVTVLARLKGTGTAKPILLLHHMDVVPADASRWSRNPFGGEIADGKIWGRGAMDMKGQGVAQIYAFITLARQRVPLDRDILLMAVPDEEIGGGLGAAWMRENHYAELDPEYIIDEGGFGTRDLFAPGKLVFGISVAEKKMLWLKLTAEGVAGHGSQPHAKNPNDRLVRALTRLLGAAMPASSSPVLETFRGSVGTLAANQFNNAIQQSTISLTSLRSGVGDPPKVNVIPSIAEATLDCRVMPGTSKAQWLAAVADGLGDPGIKIDVTHESPDPAVTTTDSSLYRALETTVKKHYPDSIVTPMVIPYGTDGNGFRARGVKTYGFTPIILPADAVFSMHGDAEFAPVNAIGPAIQVLYETLVATARKP